MSLNRKKAYIFALFNATAAGRVVLFLGVCVVLYFGHALWGWGGGRFTNNEVTALS